MSSEIYQPFGPDLHVLSGSVVSVCGLMTRDNHACQVKVAINGSVSKKSLSVRETCIRLIKLVLPLYSGMDPFPLETLRGKAVYIEKSKS